MVGNEEARMKGIRPITATNGAKNMNSERMLGQQTTRSKARSKRN